MTEAQAAPTDPPAPTAEVVAATDAGARRPKLRGGVNTYANYLTDLRSQLREDRNKQKAMLKTWPRTNQSERAAEEGALIAYYEVKALMEEVASENEAEYLLELGFVLREAGERAVRDAERARRDVERSGESDQSFHAGRLGTYRYVVSLMQQQAEVFGIPLEDLALDGFDPERDL